MAFTRIVSSYLTKLSREYQEALSTGESTPELSYRPVLDEFFRAIGSHFNPDIHRTFEPRNQARSGRPDWRFYDRKTLGVYGYIEGKGLNPANTISAADHTSQITKYLNLGQKVILTDGLDFILFSPSESEPRVFSIVDKPSSQDFVAGANSALVEQHFRYFFSAAATRQISEDQLVTETAKRASALADGIEQLSSLPHDAGVNEIENQTIDIIKDIQKTVKIHHDPLLKDSKAFSAFISQVLIFGLIYAHRIIFDVNDTPQQRYEKIKVFWESALQDAYTDHLKPFKALVLLLKSELSSLGIIGTWYEDCCLLLAHASLNSHQATKPDYHVLFERFLEAFDPSTRFDFGAFYTPQALSKYSLSLTEEVIKKVLPEVELYSNDNKLIDPCCGTGSFVEQLVASSRAKKSVPNIFGFEILPAPYALAHYRLTMIDSTYPENVEIILTNTLSDDIEQAPIGTGGLLEDEQRLARETAKTPLTLIIGNPPSTDSSDHSRGANFKIISRLVDDFRPPSKNRTSRQNTQKQLQNDFIKFLRWSCQKVIESESGVIALIIPSSFAEHPSYKYARKWLAERFNSIWITELDQDARTGVRASSIFNTLQGRLLLVATYSGDEPRGTNSFNYRDISSLTKEGKFSVLSQTSRLVDEYGEHQINSSNYNLRPSSPFDNEAYENFWRLYPSAVSSKSDSIFERHCSGLKLAPSSMLVHAKKPMLVRRGIDIGNESLSVTEIISRWYRGQDRPPNSNKFTTDIRRSIGELARDGSKIRRYSYRPFLNAWGVFDEPLLKELSLAPGGGTRYRPEVLSAYTSTRTMGIAVAPSTRDIGGSLHRFASFCWNLPDNDLCKRGNAHIYCNIYPEYKRGAAQWNPEPVNNINPVLLQNLSATDEEVTFYVYAMLCSDVFLDAFEGALYSVSDPETMPRIPFPRKAALFKKLAGLGKKIAELENPNHRGSALKDIYSKLIASVPDEFNLESFKLDSENGVIVLKQNNNAMVTIGPLAEEIIDFKVSGYNVLQQWLKMFTYKYSRSAFTTENYAEFIRLLNSIDSQISLVRQVDELVPGLLENEENLLIPN